MRESEKAEAYTAAINLLVDQAVTAANPKSPGAYAATVRADLTERHRDTAREAFRKYGELSAEHLATLLAADDKPAQPEPWTPPEPEPTAGPVLTKPLVRERIEAIKASLANTVKPPIGASE